MSNDVERRDAEFVQNVSSHQRRLYAFILRLVPDTSHALDLLQETNLILWQKKSDFTPGTNFGAWACTVAKFTVMTYRKRIGREKLLFDDELLNVIASEANTETGNQDDHLIALSECLEKLTRKDRSLLEQRYAEDRSPRHIAAAVNRTARAVAQALYRIRTSLLECMDRTLESRWQS